MFRKVENSFPCDSGESGDSDYSGVGRQRVTCAKRHGFEYALKLNAIQWIKGQVRCGFGGSVDIGCHKLLENIWKIELELCEKRNRNNGN